MMFSRAESAPGTPRLGASWPLALLVGGVVITGIAAYQAIQAARTQQITATRLLRDYAAFAAWTYSIRSSEALRDVANRTLGPIQHRELHLSRNIPDAADLADYYKQSLRRAHIDEPIPPSTTFAFAYGSDTISLHGAPVSDRVRRWMHDTVTAHGRGVDPQNDGLPYIFASIDGAPHLISYGLMPVPGGSIVYGFEFDAARFPTVFHGALVNDPVLPPALTQGRSADTWLAVRVKAPGAIVLYRSTDDASWDYFAEDTLPTDFGGLRVRAAIKPDAAPGLIIGGLPRSRLPLILLLLLLSSALSLVAVRQLRREVDLSRLRSDFVSSVSHELRTPLAQIRLLLETLRLGRFTTDEQRAWSLSSIDRETNRLSHLVENVLYFARTTRNRGEQGRGETVDLSNEVEEIVRAFEPLASARSVRLQRDLEPDLTVSLRRDAFRQVVLNLLDNAVKYGPTGQTVTIMMRRSGDTARLTIADEGPGIPPSERNAVWQPFYRGASASARAVGGSGIGLSIVRDILTQMGGRAHVGDAARGTAIVVELPIAARSHAGHSAESTTGSHSVV
jgi:signal transduction histidine kinase